MCIPLVKTNETVRGDVVVTAFKVVKAPGSTWYEFKEPNRRRNKEILEETHGVKKGQIP